MLDRSGVGEYLDDADISRLLIPKIDINEVLKVKEQVVFIEDREERRKLAFEYLEKNFSDLKTLKHWLNALHIKMFWEYLKEKLNDLGINGPCKLEGGKIVKVDTKETLVDIELIKRKFKGKGACPFTYVKMFQNFFDDIIGEVIFKNAFTKRYNKMISFDNLGNLLLRIKSIIEEERKAIIFLYGHFIEENKDNNIIEVYLFLEDLFNEGIGFYSNFETIFPNANRYTIEIFLANKLNSGETIINIEDVRGFLKMQNKENIKKALSDNSGVYPDTVLNNEFPLYKYDEEKGVVAYDYDNIDSGTFFKALNIRQKYRIGYNGGCPFAKMKSGTQQKNIFIEEFEFFDDLIINLLVAISEKQGNNGEFIDFTSKI